MTQNPVNATVNPVQMEWKEGKLPISPLFGDSYYSAPDNDLDGRDECKAVFLVGNNLPQRWQQQKHFHIAELGFGTGLNFLQTVQSWRETAPKGAVMTYSAFEQYPLSSSQIKTALSPWPDLQELANKLFLLSPDKLEKLYKDGWSQIICTFPAQQPEENQTVILEMAIGDANSLLPQWNAKTKVDAWYLDGFSPAKNPQLWNPALMQAVYNATVPNGTFSTYTSAGHVRRALSEAGFEVEKVEGFGRKRHRIQGKRPQNA